MNTVLFDSPFNKEAFVRSNKVYWEYIWQKRKKKITYWAGMSIIFLVFGIWNGIKNNDKGYSYTNYVFMNPYIFIGIGFFCLMLLASLELYFSWKKHKRKIENTANEYEKENSEYTIKISEEGVEVRDFQSHIALKWSAFTNFILYKEYIILIPTNYIAGGLVIDKNTDGLDKYNQTLTILEDKLMEA